MAIRVTKGRLRTVVVLKLLIKQAVPEKEGKRYLLLLFLVTYLYQGINARSLRVLTIVSKSIRNLWHEAQFVRKILLLRTSLEVGYRTELVRNAWWVFKWLTHEHIQIVGELLVEMLVLAECHFKGFIEVSEDYLVKQGGGMVLENVKIAAQWDKVALQLSCGILSLTPGAHAVTCAMMTVPVLVLGDLVDVVVIVRTQAKCTKLAGTLVINATWASWTWVRFLASIAWCRKGYCWSI